MSGPPPAGPPLDGPRRAGPPLAGRSVVVTRARAQSTELVERLTRLGAEVVELPVIAVVDPADGGVALSVAAHRLASGAYQWVALTSANAAERLLAALGGRAVPPEVRWAAVGAGTARALARSGRRADLVPTVAVSGHLADDFAALDPPGTGTVLFPRAETVRGDLAASLAAKGWLVDEVVAYRTVAGDPDPEAVRSAGRCEAVAFTSSSTVVRTVDLLGVDGVPPVVVTIGPVTSGSARDAGLEVSAEADPHTIDGLVDGVVAALGGDPTGPTDRSPRPDRPPWHLQPPRPR
jgi:uroporphyrinogen-III synthase